MARLALNRSAIVAVSGATLAMLWGCDGPATVDAGPDAGQFDAAGSDVPLGDAPGTDAPRDAPRTDAGRDGGTDVPTDAGPDVSAAVAAALDVICGTQAYANCGTAWDCGCDTFGSPRPERTSCTRDERSSCAFDVEPQLTAFFRRVGVTVDAAALADCIASTRRSFDLCLPNPAIEVDLPAACLDAITVGAPLGGACDFSGMRCADGAGVCGRTCIAAPSTEGATCTSFCGTGLACISGRCAAPVAAGGACTRHVDCAAPELCVGGVCGPPLALGATCTTDARCEVRRDCAGGVCTARAGDRCVFASPDCASGEECRSSSRRVCLDAGGLGVNCNGDLECDPELQCDTSRSFPGICAPLPRAGEPCSGRCELGLLCMSDPRIGAGTCQPPRRLGEACDVFGREGSVCETGLGCSGGLCAPLPRLDEPCSDDQRCEAGLGCVFVPPFFSGTCRPRQADGAMCESEDECQETSFCDTDRMFPGVCTALPGEGAECMWRCATGLECRYFPPLSRSLCVPPGRVGEECTSECAPGAYCGDDVSAGSCTALVCDFVSSGGIIFPPPIDFD